MVLRQLPLDGYHIFFDGAIVSNPANGEEIYASPISKAVVKEAIEFAHRNQTTIEFYSATRFFAERETWSTDIRRRFFGIEPTIQDFFGLWQRERIIKGTLSVSTPEEKARAERVNQEFKCSLDFSWTKTPAYPGVDFINVLAPGVSKKNALVKLARHLQIGMKDIMAIGDGDNDISVLSSVGLAIAMGNASDEVKAAADYVTLDVDHHGAAAAIEKFLLKGDR